MIQADTLGISDDWKAVARSWQRSLRGRNVSEGTRKAYDKSLAKLATWATREGVEAGQLRRDDIEGFFADLLSTVTRYDKPLEASTAAMDWRQLKVFFRWFAERENVDDPMAKVPRPAVAPKVVPVIADADLKELLAACVCPHPDKHRLDRTETRRQGCRFSGIRDRAIIRLWLDTGIRREEMAGIMRGDIDLDEQLVTVTGKGSKTRVVPFGDKTAEAVDDYTRARGRHPDRALDAMWLSAPPHGGQLGYDGLGQMLIRRCRQAGIAKVHPHQFRHTAASTIREAGLSSEDTMQIFGWSSPAMLQVYGRDQAARRAIKAAKATRHAERI